MKQFKVIYHDYWTRQPQRPMVVRAKNLKAAKREVSNRLAANVLVAGVVTSIDEVKKAS